jgi:hypothetical protein
MSAKYVTASDVAAFLRRANMPLPIAGEINRSLRRHRQPGNTIDLFAVADSAVVLTP